MAGAACCGAAARRSIVVPLLALLCLAGLCCVAGAAGASQRDHYEVLGISSDASAAEVKRAYKQLALRYHPDKNKAEDAEKVFIEIQKAYEVLGDPERRRRYDARSRFFISEENHDERDGPEGSPGAPDFGRGSVLETQEAVKEAINSGDLWLFHIYVDRQTLFGQWMAELPDDFGLGHLNVERTEEFLGMLRDMHGGRMSSLPFLMVCQSGRCRSFVPNTGGFFFMFRSVTQDVLEEAMQLVDYWRNLAHPESDEELREFAEFRPGGSARLRVMVFVEEEGERHFGMYSAANSLKGVAHVAQFCYFRAADGHGRPQPFLSKFRITRLPATVFFDPISGTHVAGGGQLGNVPEMAERILRGDASSRLNPVLEFDANTYEWRCGGGARCGSVALLATPAALEADGQALAAALGSFSKACESLKALQHLLPEPVACFWLRLGRAPSWDALFKPHRRKAEAPFAALLLHGSAAVAPDGLEANSRSLFRWLRDGLGRGGPREGALFELGEWPALPQALGLNDEADYGFSFGRAWRQVCIAFSRVRTAASHQLAAFLHPSEQDMSFYGIVLLVLAAALLLYYWLGEDEPPAEPSLEEALQGLEFQLTVGLPRAGDEKLGFGIAGHKQGGLEIKGINQGGLLEAWNERVARAEHRVHSGDRIVWVSWMYQGKSHSCSASRGVELMAKALKEIPRSTEVVLTVLPGTNAASRLQRFDGTVTLDGLMLKDCARFAYGVAEDGSQQADLEVVAIKRPLAEWNRERLREGACSSQRLEPGDRIVAVGGHTHVAQHLSDASPTVYVARWRAEGSLVSRRVEAAVERTSAEEPWGLFLAKRGRGEEQQLSVKRLAEGGVVGRWNAASSSPVLRGDHLISVNGCTSPQEIAKELQELRVVLQFERWLEPSAAGDAQPLPTAQPLPPPPPPTAAGEELPSEQPPCGRPPCSRPPNDRPPADGPLAEAPCGGGQPSDEPPGDGWDLDLDDALTSTPDHAAPAPAAARREAAGEGLPPAPAAAPSAPAAPAPAAEEPPRLPAGSAAAEPPEEEVAERPTPTGGGWDLDFGGLDAIIEPSKPSKEPQAAATASTDSGATSLGGCQPDWTLDELDFEELARPSKSDSARASTPSSAAAEAQAEVGLPDFAMVDEGGAWLQTEGPCVLAARGSAAYLRAVTGLASALGAAGTAVAFFREPRLPPDSLLVVLPRESRCRWLQWRGLDGLSGDCQNGPVAEARLLLERLSASTTGPADAPPPRPLLPLRFEPSDFARRAFGACLARPCN